MIMKVKFVFHVKFLINFATNVTVVSVFYVKEIGLHQTVIVSKDLFQILIIIVINVKMGIFLILLHLMK